MKIQIDPEKSHFDEAEEIVRLMAVALQEEECFGNDAFTGVDQGWRFLALLDGPGVPMIVSDEEGDQRSGVYDPLVHRP